MRGMTWQLLLMGRAPRHGWGGDVVSDGAAHAAPHGSGRGAVENTHWIP